MLPSLTGSDAAGLRARLGHVTDRQFHVMPRTDVWRRKRNALQDAASSVCEPFVSDLLSETTLLVQELNRGSPRNYRLPRPILPFRHERRMCHPSCCWSMTFGIRRSQFMPAILGSVKGISTRSDRLFAVALLLILSVPAWVILLGVCGRLHAPFSDRLLFYVAGYVLFGLAFWLAARGRTEQRGNSWRLAPLLLQSGLALSLLWLICSGFEGSLLVVVAAQIAAIFPLPLALGWIAAQSLVMAWIINLHWQPSVQFALVLAWLGAQVFAALMSRALANEAEVRSQLAQSNAELRATQQLLADSSRAAERVRIARELHDVLGHHLTAVSLNLEVASHLVHGQPGEHIQKAQAGTKQLLGEVRQVVGTLRGDDSLNVSRAIELLVRDIPEPHIHLRVDDDLAIFDPLRAEAILRCVQEIVTNTVKHSAAADLWIDIVRTAQDVEVHARDNGCGVHDLRLGHGLTFMRERIEQVGGRLQLDSMPANGFRVDAWIPIARALP